MNSMFCIINIFFKTHIPINTNKDLTLDFFTSFTIIHSFNACTLIKFLKGKLTIFFELFIAFNCLSFFNSLLIFIYFS